VLVLFRLINSHGRQVGIVKMHHHDGAISNRLFFIPNLKKMTCPVMTFKQVLQQRSSDVPLL
jgi:hypothetical protein